MADEITQIVGVTERESDITVLDVLDHVLNQGVIVRGNLVLALAGVDLVYLGLDVILTSVETALRNIHAVQRKPRPRRAARRRKE